MYMKGSFGAGDYYAGDYYAGDPGLFSFLGGLVKKAVGFIPGVGPIASAGLGMIGGGGGGGVGVMAPGGGTVGASSSGQNPGTIGGSIGAFMSAHPFLSGLGGAALGALGMGGAAAIPKLLAIGGQPLPGQLAAGGAFGIGRRRMHPNKSTYVRRGGGTQNFPPGLVLKGTSLVPTRRMNVANPRALRRSLRRVAGFAKLTKRVRRAVSMCASAVGVHHRGKKTIRRR